MLATHYVDAYQAAPDGAEGDAVAAQARIALRGAADRATALGAHETATAYWERARTVTADAVEEAELVEKIGHASRNLGHFAVAEATFRDALGRFRALGDRVGAARASLGLARVLGSSGHLAEAWPIAEAAAAEIGDLAPHPVLVELWSTLADEASQLGDQERSLGLADRALADAERLRATDLAIEAMQRKGFAYLLAGRPIEGRALIEASLRLVERASPGPLAARATFRLALALGEEDPRAAVELGRRTVELARRFGLGPLRLTSLMNATESSLLVGDWAWLEAELEAIDRDELEPYDQGSVDVARAELRAVRGRDTAAAVASIRDLASKATDPQMVGAIAVGLGYVFLAEGRFEEAIREAANVEGDDLNAPAGRLIAARSAVRLRDAGRARDALQRLDDARSRGAAVGLHRDAVAVAIAALDGRWPEAAAGFTDAWRRYRELRLDMGLALSALDCLAVAPAGDPLAELAAREARAILDREGATGYLAQLDRLLEERGAAGARRQASPTRAADRVDDLAGAAG